jgi:P-type Cu+ transporter
LRCTRGTHTRRQLSRCSEFEPYFDILGLCTAADAPTPAEAGFRSARVGDCTSKVVIPDFGVSADLPAFGQAAVEFTPATPGQYGVSCGMNMAHGVLVVEDGPGPQRVRPAAVPARQQQGKAAGQAVATDAAAAQPGQGGTGQAQPCPCPAPVVVPPVVTDCCAVPRPAGGQDGEAAERRAEIADLSRRVAVGAVLTAPVLPLG